MDPSKTLPANFRLDFKLLDRYKEDEKVKDQRHFLFMSHRQLFSENDLDHEDRK